MSKSIQITEEFVLNKIYFIRGKRVMLDRDLAEMYGVPTKVLNQAIKRNEKRFPSDFMFKMNAAEMENWKSQIVTSNSIKMGLRKQPNVFTEQGVAMLSSVLSSETAIEVNIQIIRVFTRIREVIQSNKEILLKLDRLEKQVSSNNGEIQTIFNALKTLLTPSVEPRKRIGFKRRYKD